MAIGIVVGLLVGKMLGILGFSLLAVRLGLAALPAGLDWGSLAVVSLLGGVGFTVSLLIAELALDGQAVLLASAVAAVLLASAVAAVLPGRGRTLCSPARRRSGAAVTAPSE